jgi:hypothetical protein
MVRVPNLDIGDFLLTESANFRIAAIFGENVPSRPPTLPAITGTCFRFSYMRTDRGRLHDMCLKCLIKHRPQHEALPYLVFRGTRQEALFKTAGVGRLRALGPGAGNWARVANAGVIRLSAYYDEP